MENLRKKNETETKNTMAGHTRRLEQVEDRISEKAMPIQVQAAYRTPNRLDKNRTTPQYIIIKTTSRENRERILKAVREKKQIKYKGKPIKITVDFSTETLKARRAWNEVFWALHENNFKPRILYPPILSLKIDGAIKVYHDKQKLKQ
jgi:hypothetical protein